MHTYIYIHTYTHIHMHTHINIYTYIHTYEYIHTYIHINIHTYTYIRTYVHTYIHICGPRTSIRPRTTLAELLHCNSNSSFISEHLRLHPATYESMRIAFVFLPAQYEQSVMLNTLLLLFGRAGLLLLTVNNAQF